VIEKNPYLREDAIVVQEYILDHAETLIKIYAVGEIFDHVLKRTFPLSAIEYYLKE
jgi:hypothetical protein